MLDAVEEREHLLSEILEQSRDDLVLFPEEVEPRPNRLGEQLLCVRELGEHSAPIILEPRWGQRLSRHLAPEPGRRASLRLLRVGEGPLVDHEASAPQPRKPFARHARAQIWPLQRMRWRAWWQR